MAPTTALTPQQAALLKARGFTPTQVSAIQNGTANFALMQNANKVLKLDPQTRFQASAAAAPPDRSPGGWGALGSAIGSGLNPGAWADFYGFGTTGQQQANAGPRPQGVDPLGGSSGDVFGGKRSVAPASAVPSPKSGTYHPNVPSGPGGRTYDIAGGPKGSLNPNGTVKTPTPGKLLGAGSETSAGKDNPYPDYIPPSPFPDLPQIDIPVISPKDFTPDATRIADSAFQPLLDSLAGSKTFIGQQGQRARKVLTGLYSNMVNDIATSAAQSHQQYDAQKQDVGQRGQALQQSIGQGYQSSQQGLSDVAQKLGLEAAVPTVSGQAANDQAWLQGMAGNQTNAMQNYFGQQQQGEDNLNANRQDVARTSGTVAQENSLNQEAAAQQGVDQQIAGAQTDRAQAAIGIGQNLTQQDLAAQQANAGYSMQGQGMTQDQLLKAWEAQNQGISGQNAYNAGKYSALSAAQQQQIDNAFKQTELDINTGKLAATAAGGTGAGLGVDDFTGVGKARQSLINSYGEKGSGLANLAQQVATTSQAISTGSLNQFISDVFAAGKAQGIYTDDELRNAAQQVWPYLLNKQ